MKRFEPLRITLMSMHELPPNLKLALEACVRVARTTPTGEICFGAIPEDFKTKGVTYHDLAILESLGYLTGTRNASYFFLTPQEGARSRSKAFDEEPSREEPVHFPKAFDWWRKRYHGRRFPFECRCKTETGVLQRVTQTRRRCPNCGAAITTEAIDDQLRRWEQERQRIMEEEKKSGLEIIGIAAAAGLMYVGSFFFGKKR